LFSLFLSSIAYKENIAMDAVFASQVPAGYGMHDHGQAAAAAAPELDPSMCCMSVVADGPRIAFAAYNEESATITVEECYANGYEVHGVVERVLMIVRPTLVLVSSKLVGNQVLMQLLTTPPPEPDDDDEERDDGDENYNQARNSPAVATAAGARTTAASGGGGAPGTQRPRSIPYQTLKTSSFDVRACQSMILDKLRVRSIMKQAQVMGQRLGHHGQQHAAQPDRHFAQPHQQQQHQSFQVSSYHALASVIDFQSNLQIQAVGSLLSFLNSTVFRLEDGGYIVVNDCVRAQVSQYMSISPWTLSALHVFATEHHPLVAAKGAGNAKEGFSLFSLLDRTSSRSGRQRLRDIMLKPLTNVDVIAMRQNGVELFMLPEMNDTGGSITKLLGRVVAVDKILIRIQKCTSKPSDIVALIRTLGVAIHICDILQHEILFNLRQRVVRPSDPLSKYPGEGGLPADSWQGGGDCDDDRAAHYVAFVEGILQSCCVTELVDLNEQLSAVIDESATSDWQTVVIRQGYSETLDQLKEQYAHLPELLRVKGKEVAARLPAFKEIIQVVFLPQVNFVGMNIELLHYLSTQCVTSCAHIVASSLAQLDRLVFTFDY
jgi:MutS domain III